MERDRRVAGQVQRRQGSSLLLCAALVAAGAAGAAPEIGILQFKVEHNLETPDCLATGGCFVQFEEDVDTAAWLAEIREASNLAILHWDRGIPWLAFDADPPPGSDRQSFYDARIDAQTLAYLQAFEAHFQNEGRGYLAVSLLDGSRSALAELYLGPTTKLPVGDACPSLVSGATFVVDPGTGPQAFDLERSYRNFLRYLAEKLAPDYIGLVVEANLFEKNCPDEAADFYGLYRSLYDDIRLDVGSGPLLFATVSLATLLEYDRNACYPTSGFVACTQPPGPPAPSAGEAACFPAGTATLGELNLGGRLDVLALSFYPDSLEMSPLPAGGLATEAFLVPDWNAGTSCATRLDFPDLTDPLVAIDRLGWSGPIAFAEVSARACVSPIRLDLPGTPPTELVFEIPGTPSSQAEWTTRMLRSAYRRDALFFAHSFLRDYAPMGPWVVPGLVPADTQALFNTWPCSGLQDASGAWKPEMTPLVLPEPGRIVGVAAAVLFAAVLASRRR